ncbi:hypothetical protein IX51_01295 [uncultured archaeon]|nr:hypothetical protein IX51_01295 [uncultured archaeon]
MYTDEALEVAVENISGIDADKLMEYGIRMKSRAALNRLGFLMEKAGMNAEKIMPLKSERYVKFGHEGDKRDRKWRVIHAY